MYRGKVVWITGASSGIGEALAYEFNREGAKLILSSNEPEELLRVRQACGRPGEVVVLPLDLYEADQLAGKAAEAIAAFGRIDVLVNNGGISQRSLVVDTSMETYRKIMQIDFMSHVAITRAVLPSMIERRSGHIVVTTSVAGKIGAPLRSGYVAAKHALHGFFDTLRAEVWREGVKVTLVAPTAVQTNVSINALDAHGQKYGRMSDHLAAGHSPEYAAKKIMAAIRKGKEEAIIGNDSLRLAVLIKRFAPGIFSKVLRKAKTN